MISTGALEIAAPLGSMTLPTSAADSEDCVCRARAVTASARLAMNERDKMKANILGGCKRRKFALLETARNQANDVENLQHDRTMIGCKGGESKLAEV